MKSLNPDIAPIDIKGIIGKYVALSLYEVDVFHKVWADFIDGCDRESIHRSVLAFFYSCQCPLSVRTDKEICLQYPICMILSVGSKTFVVKTFP